MPTLIIEIDLSEKEIETGLANGSIKDFERELYKALTTPDDVGEPYPYGPESLRIKIER